MTARRFLPATALPAAAPLAGGVAARAASISGLPQLAEDGTPSVIDLRSAPHPAAQHSTRDGSRVIGYDPAKRRFCIPYGAMAGQGAARRLVPGSFGVLVLSGP